MFPLRCFACEPPLAVFGERDLNQPAGPNSHIKHQKGCARVPVLRRVRQKGLRQGSRAGLVAGGAAADAGSPRGIRQRMPANKALAAGGPDVVRWRFCREGLQQRPREPQRGMHVQRARCQLCAVGGVSRQPSLATLASMYGLDPPTGWSWHLGFAGYGEPPAACTGGPLACCCKQAQLPEVIRLTNAMGYFGCTSHSAWLGASEWAVRRPQSSSSNLGLHSQHSQQSSSSGSTYDSFHRWPPSVGLL